MIRFFVTFILLYGGMHVYAYTRLVQTFSFGRPKATILASLMILQTCIPLLVRMAEQLNLQQSALWLAWPGYIWMGGIFIFCSILLALDCLRAVVWLFLRISTHAALPKILCAEICCEIALIAACVISSYALYEARQIRTEHVILSTAKLPATSAPIRVVQISDVHLGLLFRESRLKSVLQVVSEARPDLLVSTGDLIDGRLSREEMSGQFEQMAAMLSAIAVPFGKYACLGNHEYYAGLEQAVQYTRKAGFTVLRNQSVTLANGLTITGIVDPAYKRMGLPEPSPGESELMATGSNKDFHLLLKHRPVVAPTSDGRFDLQLSGHVHQGQIFPFNLLVRLQFPIPCGTTDTPGKSKIHVSRGSGTWGPPMRLLAPPEVTVIDIVPAKNSGRN